MSDAPFVNPAFYDTAGEATVAGRAYVESLDAGSNRDRRPLAGCWTADARPSESHRCDETCACPVHGTPLWWARSQRLHACQDPGCRYATGVENDRADEASAEARTGGVPARDGAYSSGERAAYVPDPCPKCGARATVDWIDVEAYGSGPQWLPGVRNCTARCNLGGGS